MNQIAATANLAARPDDANYAAEAAAGYRPDIDGLRAIAVGMVMLYHAGLSFPGGFIGVDVFFVISGYLITQKLQGDHGRGLASIATFYSRRAKRILPALFFIYMTCLFVGMIIMLPVDLKELGLSTFSSAISISNFYFYSISGYFDGPSHEKPLLHTWSLSIEEQFYFLWPMLCFCFLFNRSKDKQATFVATAIIFSAIAAQYLQSTNPSAAFFWPISRAWELLAGALIAIKPLKFGRQSSSLIAAISLSAIVISGLLLNSRSFVPGISALPAIVGSALLIALGPTTIASRVLSTTWMVRLGLISYSLYLWHWPLLAFTKYYLERDLSKPEATLAVVGSLALAAISWRYIEKPARLSKLSVRAVLATSIAVIALSSVAGTLISRISQVNRSAPFAQTALKDANIFNPLLEKCHGQQAGAINTSSECRIGAVKDTPDFVLIGDSHADHFSPAFDAAGREAGLSGMQITHGGCLPIWRITQITGGKAIQECDEYRSQTLDYIKQLPAGRTVVMAARWTFYLQTIGPNVEVPYFVIDDSSSEATVSATRRNMTAHLRETIGILTDVGHHVLLVAQLPEYPFFRLNCFIRHAAQKNAGSLCGDDKEALSNLMQPADDLLLEALQGSTNATIVRPAELLCKSGRCVVEQNGVFLYRDLHHLNKSGAQQFGTLFAEALRKIQ